MRKSLRVRILSALFLAGAFTQLIFAAPDDKPRPPETASRHQFGIPPGIKLEKLIGKPTLLNKFYFVFNDPVSGESRISGFADAVAVYDLPIEGFIAVMLACEAQSGFIPYFMKVKILERGASEDLIEYKTGIKFLGIEASYNSIFGSTFERIEGGAVGFRSRLVESIDGKEFEHYTSYYFAPVTVNGKVMTFFRYFNRPGVRKPMPGMVEGMRFFIPFAIEGHIAALAKEVARRAKL